MTGGEVDISLEWKDMEVTCRILGNYEGGEENEFLPLFPEPSPKIRKPDPRRKSMKNGSGRTVNGSLSTLSNLIGADVASDAINRSAGAAGVGNGFYQESNLKRHMVSHTGNQSFKCIHCRATFSTKSVLSVHMREAHGRRGGGMAVVRPQQQQLQQQQQSSFECGVCNKKFQKRENYLNHIALHKSVPKLYQCNICSLKFADEFIWREHTLMHKKTTLPCSYCTNTFSSPQALAQHVAAKHPA